MAHVRPIGEPFGVVLMGVSGSGKSTVGRLLAQSLDVAFLEGDDYHPARNLEKIEAAVLAINAADDERNPPETGVTEAALKRIKNARLLLIPPSEDTRGHGTTASAKFYARELGDFLQKVPQRGM